MPLDAVSVFDEVLLPENQEIKEENVIFTENKLNYQTWYKKLITVILRV